jgi:ATP-dependent RNA helicase DDX10/DBP4
MAKPSPEPSSSQQQQRQRRRRPPPNSIRSKEQKEREREASQQEIERLRQRTQDEAPARGYAPPVQQLVAFRALPLSSATLKGLEGAKTPFTTMTDIQNACIPHALAGRDILGAVRCFFCRLLVSMTSSCTVGSCVRLNA